MNAPTQNPSSLLGSLRIAILSLALARAFAARRKLKVKELVTAFEATIADDARLAKKAADEAAAAEAEVKVLTEALYAIDQNAKPTAGVEVKKYKSVQITDAAAALEWAKRTDLCLVPESLDVNALTALVLAGQVLPFAKLVETPKATVASDLVKALGDAYTLPSFDASVELIVGPKMADPFADDPFADPVPLEAGKPKRSRKSTPAAA